jgi:hypothetical protein
MIHTNKNIREIVEIEEPEFDNAWEHSMYHLKIGAGVLFEEFEGRDHKKLYSKLIKTIEKIEDEYKTYRGKPSIITKDQYLNLKYFYVNDDNAMNYPFPIRILKYNVDENTINVRKLNEPSEYLVNEFPWLNDI